ncbi:MAG: hypothetical protein R3E54_06440 [Halioglobus sp.]
MDPPFIAELAHYEWVELALDVAEDELPEPAAVADIAVAVPTLSPLAWSLAYQYPVHRIGSGFRPERAEAPTYLVVYRDRRDSVRFMEVNAPTARLLELVAGNTERSVEQLLALLAAEMETSFDAIRAAGLEQFEQLVTETVVCLTVS